MPSISKLRFFGCSGHVHLLIKRRTWKLARRSRPDIMLGLENGPHRIWDIAQHGVVGTKHVVFDETEFPPLRQNGRGRIFCTYVLSSSKIDNNVSSFSVDVDLESIFAQ